MIKTGICGFSAKRELIYSTLDAVELQETFYSMPNAEKIRKLRIEAPENFDFSVKVFQGITHGFNSPTMKKAKNFTPNANVGLLKDTRENLELWEIFKKQTSVLNPVVYVFQTPPSFGSEDQLKQAYSFFREINGEARIGWEPRGKAYENLQLLLKIFEDLSLIHIVDPFKKKPIKAFGLQYFRLHGKGSGEVNYGYNYTDNDLFELYNMVKNYDRVYVMFNNIKMFENAKIFKERFVG